MNVSFSMSQADYDNCEVCGGSGIDPCTEPYPDDLFLIYPEIPRCRACHERDEEERDEIINRLIDNVG